MTDPNATNVPLFTIDLISEGDKSITISQDDAFSEAHIEVETGPNQQIDITQETTEVTIGAEIIGTGPPGLSAYEVWIGQGNQGSIEFFLDSLRAEKGGSLVYEVPIPSELWTVPHNLSKYPSVTVVDSSGRVMYGTVTYLDQNSLSIAFSAGFSGKVYLN